MSVTSLADTTGSGGSGGATRKKCKVPKKAQFTLPAGKDVGFDPATMNLTALVDTTGSGGSGGTTLLGQHDYEVG